MALDQDILEDDRDSIMMTSVRLHFIIFIVRYRGK